MLTRIKLMVISHQLMKKISFPIKMMLQKIITMLMMSKASEVQHKIPNIKLLHLNHQLLNKIIKLKKQHKHLRTSKCKPFSTDQIERIIEYSLYQGKPIQKINFKDEPQSLWQDGTKSRKPLRTLSISSTVQKE